jgi:integrase
VHDLQEQLSPPSVKQHLAAIRMLFDWLVTGHVIDTNPAHSVRGLRYTVKKGKTPVLTAEEAHALLESIPITKKPANDTEAADQPDLLGLRDRDLIAIMVYSFARIGAVSQMKVGDYPGVFTYRVQHFTEAEISLHYWALLIWDCILVTVQFHDPACNCNQCRPNRDGLRT